LIIGLVLAACASIEPPPSEWHAAVALDHPLVGRIWAPPQGRFVAPNDVVVAAARARFVLLGEKHDNPDHHRLQAWMMRALVGAGARPGLAFEMIAVDRQAALDAATAATDIGAVVGWRERGWPDWAMYAPIAAAAREAGLPILAADLPRAQIRAATRAVPGTETGLSDAAISAIAAEMEKSHCGMVSGEAAARMASAQIARDAFMAERLIEAARTKPARTAVLIAGGGHIVRDRGVPFHLARLAPDGATVALAFLEVQRDAMLPADYAARIGRDALPFDFVWFTPRVDDADPCDTQRDRMRRLPEGAPR
jgi:uncharacterized iron-regulated protein